MKMLMRYCWQGFIPFFLGMLTSLLVIDIASRRVLELRHPAAPEPISPLEVVTPRHLREVYSGEKVAIGGIDSLERRLEEHYDIDIEAHDAGELLRTYGVHAVPFSEDSLQGKFQNLHAWLRKYPSQFLRNSGLQTVYLFKGWEVDGVEVGGLVLDEHAIGVGSVEYVFHHELFHLADLTDGGMHSENNDWQRLKEGQLRPHSSADPLEAVREVSHLRVAARPGGYTSVYGQMGGIDEDQATIVEEMMTNLPTLLLWAEQDPVLARGVEHMKRTFYAWSNGRMDATYWGDLVRLSVLPDGYWEQRERAQDFVLSPALEDERQDFLLLLEARLLNEQGEFHDAEQIFLDLIHRRPGSTKVTWEFGAFLEKHGKYQKAIDVYLATAKTQPDNQLDLPIARNYARLGDLEAAMRHYIAAFERAYLKPEDVREFQSLSRRFIQRLREDGRDVEASAWERRMRELPR